MPHLYEKANDGVVSMLCMNITVGRRVNLVLVLSDICTLQDLASNSNLPEICQFLNLEPVKKINNICAFDLAILKENENGLGSVRSIEISHSPNVWKTQITTKYRNTSEKAFVIVDYLNFLNNTL